jgi:hypothetical protein
LRAEQKLAKRALLIADRNTTYGETGSESPARHAISVVVAGDFIRSVELKKSTFSRMLDTRRVQHTLFQVLFSLDGNDLNLLCQFAESQP